MDNQLEVRALGPAKISSNLVHETRKALEWVLCHMDIEDYEELAYLVRREYSTITKRDKKNGLEGNISSPGGDSISPPF